MKNYLEVTILALLAVFAPIKAILITTLVLVIADLITGIVAAYKRKEPITSTGLKQSVLKGLVYEAAICLGYVAEHFLIGDLLPVTKIIGALIGMTELLSCVENLNSINGSPVFGILIGKLNQALQSPKADAEKPPESDK